MYSTANLTSYTPHPEELLNDSQYRAQYPMFQVQIPALQ